MDQIEAKKRIEQLVSELNEHAHKYYILDAPSISDFEYDQLNNELSSTLDLFPTLLQLAGGSLAADRDYDGKNIWPLITQEAVSPHDYYYYFWIDELQGVRNDKWKLIIRQDKGEEELKPRLYQLQQDPYEIFDMAESEPEIVDQLLAELHRFAEETGAKVSAGASASARAGLGLRLGLSNFLGEIGTGVIDKKRCERRALSQPKIIFNRRSHHHSRHHSHRRRSHHRRRRLRSRRRHRNRQMSRRCSHWQSESAGKRRTRRHRSLVRSKDRQRPCFPYWPRLTSSHR